MNIKETAGFITLVKCALILHRFNDLKAELISLKSSIYLHIPPITEIWNNINTVCLKNTEAITRKMSNFFTTL